MTIRQLTALVLASAVGVSACQNKPDRDLAPVATTIEPARAATKTASRATVDSEASTVNLEMKAPLENIYGVVKNATTGELFIDLSNIQKTTGLLQVSLQQLVLTQEKREKETVEFGVRQKQDLQNEHAKTWLEISADTPDDERRANEIATFRITNVANVSNNDVTKLSGAKREVTASVTGDFVLHQRKVEKTATMRIVFEFDGDQVKGVQMTTVAPFVVDLTEHDVRPRKAFGVLADATLATLGRKVDKQPKISLDLRATLSAR